jgi:hypothetical protein
MENYMAKMAVDLRVEGSRYFSDVEIAGEIA